MNIHIDFTGQAALMRELGAFSRAIQDRVLAPVVKEAGKLIASAASALVPVRSGLLKRSIGVSKIHTYRHAGSDTLFIAAGPRRGFRRALKFNRKGRIAGFFGAKKSAGMATGQVANPVRYAHLVERGHAIASHRGGRVSHTYRLDGRGNRVVMHRILGGSSGGGGAVPPHPFMEPAGAAVGPAIRAMAEERLAAAVAAESQRLCAR
ncbi:MAG: HK97 gp10 family phage protein [Candidatus Polarisedimenticolia bacterium]